MEQENKVIVYPGSGTLQNMTVRELTDLRMLVLQYDDCIKKVIRDKNR